MPTAGRNLLLIPRQAANELIEQDQVCMTVIGKSTHWPASRRSASRRRRTQMRTSEGLIHGVYNSHFRSAPSQWGRLRNHALGDNLCFRCKAMALCTRKQMQTWPVCWIRRAFDCWHNHLAIISFDLTSTQSKKCDAPL